jgi:AcrR family transcriptional regulator
MTPIVTKCKHPLAHPVGPSYRATPMSTEHRILDAALRVFEQAGFRGATTRRIAEEAHVNEVTLFRHFGTKDELLLAALRRAQDLPREGALPDEPVDPRAEIRAWARAHMARLLRWRHVMQSSFTEVEAHPRLCAMATNGPMRTYRELAGYLARLQEGGKSESRWDARVAASFFLNSLFAEAIAKDVMPDRHDRDPNEIAEAFADLFLDAIGVPRTESVR